MIEIYIVNSIILLALIVGSYTDLKSREVPDWVSKGLMFIGISINLLFTAVFSDWSYIIHGIVGFILAFIIALLMYYTGQWGGGDSKMIMGIGALVGFSLFSPSESILLSFLVNLLIVGAAYGLLWSSYLAIKRWKEFSKEYRSLLEKAEYKPIWYIIVGILGIGILSIFFIRNNSYRFTIWLGIFLLSLFYYMLLYVKAIENSCMLKRVSPKVLTEGDWIAKNIVINGKIIAGPKDLGIDKKAIRELIRLWKLGKVKNVLIKEGIPFIPSFLLAYTLTLIVGNISYYFISLLG